MSIKLDTSVVREMLHEDNLVNKSRIEVLDLSPGGQESYRNGLQESKMPDNNLSIVITSFYTHGVSFIEIVENYITEEPALAFKSVTNFLLGCMWIVVSV
jgi:hypothetical protein